MARDPSDEGEEPELRAFRDAMRDIFATDGRVEIAFDDLPAESHPARAAQAN